MPKKKPIAKRLKQLFQDITPEEAPVESKRAVRRRSDTEKASDPVDVKSVSPATRPVEMVTRLSKAEPMSLAFQMGKNTWATLQVVDEEENRRWTPDEQLLVKQVTDQLSLALENAQLFQETQRRAQEMTALAEVGREISATLQVENILEKIAIYAKDLLQAETSAVYLPDAESKYWNAISVIGEDAEEIKNDPILSGRGILGGIIVNKTGRIVNDASNDRSSVTVAGTVSRDFEHIMGVPILSMDRATGLMAVWRTGAEKDFTSTELEFLGSLAQQAAIAIENARLYQQEQYRRQVADTLSELARIASSSLNLTDVVHRLLEQLPRLVSFRTATIQLIHKDGRRQQVGGISKDASRAQTLETPGSYFLRKVEEDALISEIVKTKDVVIIADTYNDPRWDVLPETQSIRSWLGAPLLVGADVVGILILDENVQNAYNQNVADLVRSFTPQAAIAIQNASLFQNVKDSQGQLSEALRIARIGYFEIDLQKELITFTDEMLSLLNTSVEKEGGYQFPLDQVLEKFVVAEDIQIVTKAVEDAVEGVGNRGDLTSEVRYKTTDGRIIWVSSVYKVECDEKNQPVKVAGSSQDITERKTNELTQAAITHISESALISKTIDELYKSVHDAVSSLMPAENFYIASYDPGSRMITFPYHVDVQDDEWSARKLGRGLTSYVIRTGKSLHTTPEIFSDLEASGEVVNDGARNVDWLGVPLRSKQVVNGVIAVQTYDTKVRITEKHRDILTVLAPQVVSAIERFVAEREIQKFKLGIDRSENAVFITDLEGTIEYANPAFENVYGYKPEEAIGKTPRILKSGLIPDEQYKLFWNTLLSGSTVSGEMVNKRKDGRILPISGTNTPILDETGKTIGFLAIHQDITGRKQSEQALQRRNTYLAASSEIGRLVTSTLDLNTIFTRTVSLISERFGFYFAAIYITEETGFSARLQEAKGEAGEKMKVQKHSFVVGSPTIVGRVAESGESLLVNNTEQEPLYQHNPLLLDTRAEVAIPLRVGSRIIGVIDIQSTQESAFSQDDVSVLQSLADQVAVAIDNARSYELSQQLIKDLREVDQLKSQFLANMSHELRTPLNSIIGFSRVIIKGIDGPITEMQSQDLTAIYNSGQHLLGLINDILDLARIEAGKMELNFEEVHLSEMVTSVMSTAKGLVKEKPIQLIPKVPADMPTVRGDTMRVRQVLINLLSNASKFTDEGTITVETKVQKGPNGKPEALISVIDTGPGISAEGQEKLFKAFSQVDGSATRKSGGSGLGLSICANLVQLHGGRISVHSLEGKGSTFWFTLPLFNQPMDEIPEGKKVVLAIDDDPQVISLYERYLNPQGYYVVPLTDPSRAKERILELKPFAVTLDIMMPGTDGWTVLTDLKSDPETRDYPVVICSIMEQTDKGFSLGASDYLVKPILEDDLTHALDHLNKNGDIKEVLVIDDDPNDLRLIEKLLNENGRYKPILAEGGRKGWELINQKTPDAIILDIFMPDMDGFMILEKMRENPLIRDIPVLVVSGGGLTNEQHQQLNDFGQRLITKGSLKETELIANIENALNRIKP